MRCTGRCRQDYCGGSGLGHACRLIQQTVLPKAGVLLQRMGHLASLDELVLAALLERRQRVAGEEGNRDGLGWEE